MAPDVSLAKPDRGAWKRLPNPLGARASYRCYWVRMNKFMKPGRKQVWACDVRNETNRGFALSIKLTARNGLAPPRLTGRSTVKAGSVYEFHLLYTGVLKGGAVTMWHGSWCWEGQRCRRRGGTIYDSSKPLGKTGQTSSDEAQVRCREARAALPYGA